MFTDASVDPYNAKCVRATAGSLFHLPVVHRRPTVGRRCARRARGRAAGARRGRRGRATTAGRRRPRRGAARAWIFGNEAWGLPEEVARWPTTVVRVPIHGRAESPEPATAAAVCLYARAHGRSGRRSGPPSSSSVGPVAVALRARPSARRCAGAARRWRPARDGRRRPARRAASSPTPTAGSSSRQPRPAARLLGRPRDGALGRDFRDVLPLQRQRRPRLVELHRPVGRAGAPAPATASGCCSCPAAGELLVTAALRPRPGRSAAGRPGRRRPARRRRPRARRGEPRRPGLHRRPRAALAADQRQGLHRHAAGRSGTGSPTTRSGSCSQTVNADADRVTRLITELLDVSRIDAGRLEVRRQLVDLPAAVAHGTSRGSWPAGEPSRRFGVDVDDELPEMWVDPDRIDQILANLMENAVRHGDGTVTVEVALDDRRHRRRPWSVPSTDEGEGIADEHLPPGLHPVLARHAAAAAPASVCTSSRAWSRRTAADQRGTRRPAAAPSSDLRCPPAPPDFA